jgi:hypothetical protein
MYNSATVFTPLSTGLNGTQFSSNGINDPEGPEKYNNTKVKKGQFFTAATQNLTPAVIKYKYVSGKTFDPSEALNTTQLHEKCRI